ncbi:hypothetical protein COW81_03170 [Candidatus Campbellbacteria bacterium CG22_combo_CG10-13_8_21_14_all_36_13]|uniref:Uncharacterized protein n=1 Tax=Candidatus Campbellbacteria bacterium CG22_combo_CG10-13_8_21_14_all_36_13 TaxID=1974529 RepID=A0A2H0DXK3_9BACT|nr:MAG: hypothetical protein COW81_03170 [Candidatus Campbellbacteria bacterium CG22_combo_CG10-13_8_21_14_all_36_13]
MRAKTFISMFIGAFALKCLSPEEIENLENKGAFLREVSRRFMAGEITPEETCKLLKNPP